METIESQHPECSPDRSENCNNVDVTGGCYCPNMPMLNEDHPVAFWFNSACASVAYSVCYNQKRLLDISGSFFSMIVRFSAYVVSLNCLEE